jgi:segregation and condensation protein A
VIIEVRLDAYEGPLDILLTLIRRHEINIYDIPISTLTNQYLQEIANLPSDMEQLSEFLVMAATLLEIKSRMLLPRHKPETAGEVEDPREALVQKLVAYKQAQALAQELQKLSPIGERVTNLGDKQLLSQIKHEADARLPVNMVTVTQLMEIFADVMSRKENRRDTVRADYGKMPRDRFTVTQKVTYIRGILESRGRASLRALFSSCNSRNEIVVTFLALLEMVRQGEIRANQTEAFSDVEICAA